VAKKPQFDLYKAKKDGSHKRKGDESAAAEVDDSDSESDPDGGFEEWDFPK